MYRIQGQNTQQVQLYTGCRSTCPHPYNNCTYISRTELNTSSTFTIHDLQTLTQLESMQGISKTESQTMQCWFCTCRSLQRKQRNVVSFIFVVCGMQKHSRQWVFYNNEYNNDAVLKNSGGIEFWSSRWLLFWKPTSFTHKHYDTHTDKPWNSRAKILEDYIYMQSAHTGIRHMKHRMC